MGRSVPTNNLPGYNSQLWHHYTDDGTNRAIQSIIIRLNLQNVVKVTWLAGLRFNRHVKQTFTTK